MNCSTRRTSAGPPGLVRVAVLGALAMAVTAGIGRLFGAVV
jgi:hypothetical protein